MIVQEHKTKLSRVARVTGEREPRKELMREAL